MPGPWTAILFDLDGTIIDSAPNIVDALLYMAREMGCDEPDLSDLSRFIGPPMRGTIEWVVGSTDPDVIAHAMEIYRRRSDHTMADTPTFPGMAELIRELHSQGVALGVATSKRRVAAERTLTHHGLAECFTVIAGADETDTRAEKAEIVEDALAGLQASGVDTSNVVLVGDRHHDIDGGHAHGLAVIHVAWGYGAEEESHAADLAARSVPELRALLCDGGARQPSDPTAGAVASARSGETARWAAGRAPELSRALPSRMDKQAQLFVNDPKNGWFYRIPALCTAPNGDLLACCDKRPETPMDAPNPNWIVQRRSTDGGQTWQEETVIRAGVPGAERRGYSDPCYVVDWQTGSIFNLHVRSADAGFFDSAAGVDPEDRSVIQVEVSRSDDNGHTWEHQLITEQITPGADTCARFVTSGQGIQLVYGEHAGRLVAPMTVRNSQGQQAQAIFSDDHGRTWKAGEAVGENMDENTIAELSDGTLLLNSRDFSKGGCRKVCYSHDGGQTWSRVTAAPDLHDPANNAQLIRAFPHAAPGSDEAKILLFVNAWHPDERTHGTIHVSTDDGQSWPQRRTVVRGEVGYPTIAVQADGSLGMLWEDGGIRYANLTWRFLCGE